MAKAQFQRIGELAAFIDFVSGPGPRPSQKVLANWVEKDCILYPSNAGTDQHRRFDLDEIKIALLASHLYRFGLNGKVLAQLISTFRTWIEGRRSLGRDPMAVAWTSERHNDPPDNAIVSFFPIGTGDDGSPVFGCAEGHVLGTSKPGAHVVRLDLLWSSSGLIVPREVPDL